MTKGDFDLTAAHEEGRAPQEGSNPLPRSVSRANEYELLDGEWRFALDAEDRGLKERWYRSHKYERTARWPGSIESHMAEAKDAQEGACQDQIVAWYEREFTIPERWFKSPTALVQVSFGACGYETRVWLNGVLLCPTE